MDYKKLNNITGWAVFIIATIVYIATVEPTTSLWDCGEYITTSNKLEVGHPPGAPFFMMLGRVFSAFASAENAALMVNVMSALSSSFTILFLFWTITAFGRKIAESNGEALSKGKIFAILGSGAVGGLAYTFSDSFWFSAIEGEVYAMSSFFTAITFWAIMKWERLLSDKFANRWLLFIAYMVGLSIGVHLLNLLVVPAIAYIYYFRKYEFSIKGFIIAGVTGLFTLVLVQNIIIPKLVWVGHHFEYFAKNTLGLSFHLGTLIFVVLLFTTIILALYLTQSSKNDEKSLTKMVLSIALLNFFIFGMFGLIAAIVGNAIFIGLWYAYKKQLLQKGPEYITDIKIGLNTAITAFALIVIGMSTFAMILIRSNANPPLDENDPSTMTSLLSYLNREQYGDWPVLYGQYYNSPLLVEDQGENQLKQVFKDGSPTIIKAYEVYHGKDTVSFISEFEAKQYIAKNKIDSEIVGRYITTNDGKDKEGVYNPDFMVVFPRMYRRGEGSKYEQWIGKPELEKPFTYRRNGRMVPLGDGRKQAMPSYSQNLSYFFNYQLGWMYFRYFMWNFSGKQNDTQGHNNSLFDGRWISGVNFIDDQRLGRQDNLPASVTRNKGHNKFFMIPLILGLIGLIFQFIKAPKDGWVVTLLFVMTGLAIIVYLNQKPQEPRERDYAFAASFYAFSIWIGLSVYALYYMAKNMKWADLTKIAAFIGGAIALFLVAESVKGDGYAISLSFVYIGLVALGLGALMVLLRQANLKGPALAAIATIICLSAPILMAKDGWDDHTRANRYTAREMAKNYLKSCEKNAILFTNGDNDTFPLWYVQEVEGYRTDVRVVNMSLLGTDWHVNQMRRKAYDSDPVPFNIPERKYRQGTRDVVQVIETSKNPDKFNNLKLAMSIAVDDNKRKPSKYSSKKEPYFPTKKVFITVNKENVLNPKYGILPEGYTGKIEDTIKWSISGDHLTKADFMVCDLLSNYDWTRPIYFASSQGMGANSNLRPYLMAEGLVYKLTPIRSDKTSHRYLPGQYNEDKMYDLFMGEDPENSFQWGNMNDPNVYMCHYNMRMIRSPKLFLTGLIQELGEKGDTTRVINLIDKHYQEMPPENVPFTNFTPYMVEAYYKAGRKDRGELLAKQFIEYFNDDLRYFFTLEPKFALMAKSDFENSFALVRMCYQIVVMNDPTSDYAEQLKTLMDELGVKAQQMENDLQRYQLEQRVKESGGRARKKRRGSRR